MVRIALKEIGNFPDIDYSSVSRRTVEEVLRPVSLSFSVEHVSRATTHEICEGNDSFTQQSMRYVKMGNGAFVVPPGLSLALRREFSDTMGFLLNNYDRLSELKNEYKGSKGRPKANWFKFAPIEDNRYALSLASPSNILVTMHGGQLLNFFGSLSRGFESEEIFDSLVPYMPKSLTDLCRSEIGSKDFSVIEFAHREKLLQGLSQVRIDMLSGRFERAGIGALTSTNSSAPSELVAGCDARGDRREKLEDVANRVLGYHHDSIIEHARAGCSLGMTCVSYHQFQRHRIPANIREDFRGLPLNREVLVPPRIKQSTEAIDIFHSSVEAARSLREKIMNENPSYNHFALPNGTLIGVYSNVDARTLYHIASERFCNNTQWEFRGLMESLALSVRKPEPRLYANLAPKCVVQDGCPEGRLGCGRYKEVKSKYVIDDGKRG